MPTLDSQIDLRCETWTNAGALISADCMAAVEGWADTSLGTARWYGPAEKTTGPFA